MPIFHKLVTQDKDFADTSALQLVRHNVNVWLDRWELHIGDSIIDRVQRAIDGSSALLLILSQSSVRPSGARRE